MPELPGPWKCQLLIMRSYPGRRWVVGVGRAPEASSCLGTWGFSGPPGQFGAQQAAEQAC